MDSDSDFASSPRSLVDSCSNSESSRFNREDSRASFRCGVCSWAWDGRIFDRLINSPPYHRSFQSRHTIIRMSAESCVSCRAIYECLTKFGMFDEESYVGIHSRPATLPPDGAPEGQVFRNLGREPEDGVQVVVEDFEKPETLRDDDALMQFFTIAQGSAARHWVPRLRLVSGDTSSADTLSWAAGWLAYCDAAHGNCLPKQQDIRLPTRLLDVQALNQEGDVRLVLSQHMRTEPPGHNLTRYVALSHCWGTVPVTCCTTNETLIDRVERIPWSQLPLTFQHAITFTRGLGVRYLWIDSICIIQDNMEDWHHEAASMASVYGASYVTLAGVHATDSTKGLFARTPEEYLAKELSPIRVDELLREADSDVAPEGDDDSEIRIFARQAMPSFHSWKMRHMDKQSALFTRAWTYQERLLSPRVLFFSSNEVLFECFEDAGCECTRDAPDPTTTDWKDLRHPGYNPKFLHRRGGTWWDPEDVSGRWRECIEEYSQLTLTKPRDRLPAIGGIASEMVVKQRPGDEYLAGLWKDTLLEDLDWHSADAKARQRRNEGVPTWSWASVQCGVRFGDESPSPCIAEVVEAVCSGVLAGNPFGDIESGRLVLRTQVARCRLLSGRELLLSVPGANLDSDGIEIGSWSPDYNIDDETCGRVLKLGEVLFLARIRGDLALLLCLVDDEKGYYERVGIRGVDKTLQKTLDQLPNSIIPRRNITIV